MKCPMCVGVGEVQVGTGWPSDEGGELTEIVQCPHCDGTGEIQDGSVWKGECRGTVKILQYHHASGYSFFDAVGELDGYWAEHSEYAPVLICRMKEVG